MLVSSKGVSKGLRNYAYPQSHGNETQGCFLDKASVMEHLIQTVIIGRVRASPYKPSIDSPPESEDRCKFASTFWVMARTV